MSGARRAALAVVVVALAAGCSVESNGDEQALPKAPTTPEEAREWREANPLPPPAPRATPPPASPPPAPPTCRPWPELRERVLRGRQRHPAGHLPLLGALRFRLAALLVRETENRRGQHFRHRRGDDLQVIQEGQAIVNIAPTDGGFFSQGCQPWEPR